MRLPLHWLLCSLATLAVASLAQPPPAVRTLAAAEAGALLRKPVRMDPAAARVMKRVEAGYGRLQSLKTVSRGGPLVATALLKRPRYYQFVQKTGEGQLIALANSDGRTYREYSAAKRQYLEREITLLDRLALPLNVRLFFPAQTPGGTMVGLHQQPTARDYAFRHVGREKLRGKPVDVIRVSTMSRSREGSWRTFESTRYYDAATGLLLRAVSGKNTIEITNTPNPKLTPEEFRWRPIPGAVRGFG